MERELCCAEYRAEQVPGAVIIIAIGSHRVAGYHVYFQKGMHTIFPPEYTLYHEAPSVPTADVISPFAVYTQFKATDLVKEVVVRDVNGTHRVAVEQVPDLRAEIVEGFNKLPPSETARRIDFEDAQVVGGFVNDTFFLVVSGVKSYLNMEVRLVPLVYVRQPEYWGIEVIGILPGIGLPATAPYTVVLPLDHVIGTKGVEVIGATKTQEIDIAC